jgi:hypothetical protein
MEWIDVATLTVRREFRPGTRKKFDGEIEPCFNLLRDCGIGCTCEASTWFRDGVPTIDGFYNAYMPNMAIQGLFKDDDFKLLYRGEHGSAEYKFGTIFTVGGIRFVPTTMSPQQTIGGVAIDRTIVCGQGALIEGEFDGQDAQDTPADLHLTVKVEGVSMITREPMDRLKQIIAQSWSWIGGYAVPSDMTADTLAIPTANNSWYKRAIVLESARSPV